MRTGPESQFDVTVQFLDEKKGALNREFGHWELPLEGFKSAAKELPSFDIGKLQFAAFVRIQRDHAGLEECLREAGRLEPSSGRAKERLDLVRGLPARSPHVGTGRGWAVLTE